MEVTSTQLRFIRTKTADELSLIVDKLPFKVEIKSIVPKGDSWLCWFVVPDTHGKFKSVDLTRSK